MKVLFVTHDGTSHEPLGLMYVSAALLRAGHKTKACQQSLTLQTVDKWSPDFIAFQVLTGDQDRWGSVAKSIKQHHPKIKAIFGGPHYTYFAKAKQPEADFLIRGDGENSIVDVVNGKQVPSKATIIEDLSDIEFPDRTLFYNDDFPGIKNNVIRNFIATRGCIFKCKYCYNSSEDWQKMVPGKLRTRNHTPERMVEEIEKCFSEYGGELVSFQDDIFGIDMDWLEQFVSLYKKIRIPFFAQLRPALITEERVKLLKEAGIHIASFAVESGNEKTRREILDRYESNDLIKNGVSILQKYNIKFRMQNLLGLPVENPLEDALETLRFNIECKPTLSWCSMLQCFPGTKIADLVIEQGLVKSADDLMYMVNATFFEECSLPIKDKLKIERLHRYWAATVRWPWIYWLVTKVLIHIDFGSKFHHWIFNYTKQWINRREYWRVDKMDKHISILNTQKLDRLGNEPERIKKVHIDIKECV